MLWSGMFHLFTQLWKIHKININLGENKYIWKAGSFSLPVPFPWMWAVQSLTIKTFTVYPLLANNLQSWDLNPGSLALMYMKEPINSFTNTF